MRKQFNLITEGALISFSMSLATDGDVFLNIEFIHSIGGYAVQCNAMESDAVLNTNFIHLHTVQ